MTKSGEKNNVHAGHRQRMYEQYDASGFENMHDHQILEMLLFQSIKRGDTNVIAHRLLETFHTLSNVFHAPMYKLKAVDGVGEKTARYLTMLGGAFDAAERVRDIKKLTPKNSTEFFKNLFYEKHRETFYIICLDANDNIICCRQLNEGSFESTEVDVGKAIKVALDFNSPQVVFAHNHPSGILKASDADITVTRVLESAMHMVGVRMRDHIIYANEKCISIMSNYKIKKDRSLEKYSGR